MSGSAIKAILFDLDGTLYNSGDAILSAVERTLTSYNRTFDREVIARQAHSLRAVHELAGLSSVPYEEFRDKYHDAYESDQLSAILWYEHVQDVLDTLRDEGLLLAIVSSSKFARQIIDEHELSDYFDVVVSGGDVSEHKPHPEPIFLATQRLGIRADEAIMVGDMIVDVQAGKAAGVARTIAVTHGMGDRADLVATNPDHIIDSLAELRTCWEAA